MQLPLEKAKERALLFLKFRPRSEAELSLRLKRLGFDADVVTQVISEFKAKGIIDDAKFARYFARASMNMKPSGRRGVAATLKAKGIPAELAARAAEEASEGKDDLTLARELARKKFASFRGDLERQAVQRRLFGFLSRRGFSPDVVYQVVREVGGGSEII